MAHDKDHDHRQPAPGPKAKAPPLASKSKPYHERLEHPTGVPREPLDPRAHPGRR